MSSGLLKALQRLALGLAVIGAVSLLLFLANEKMGDPVYALLPVEASDAERAALRESLGLDGDLLSRLLVYLKLTLTGDFGRSYKLDQPVMSILPPYLWGTCKLIGLALPIGITAGTVLGMLGLWIPPLADRLLQRVLLVLHAIPGFVPAILAIELFAVKLRWLPPSGSEGWTSLVMPVALLAGAEAIKIAILLRSKLQEVQREPFVLAGRAKGLRAVTFYMKYMLRPSFSLIFSFAAIQIGVLLSSIVVIESVFAYPGVGSLAIQAVSNRDLPLLQACIVVTTLLFIGSRFLVDLFHPLLDPRLKQTRTWERSLW